MTRKQEIIQTAKILFREKGYKSISMRDLATAMNIKAASLYNHISSKEEILSEIILGVAQYFTAEMQKVKNTEENAQLQLEAVIAHHVEINIQAPEAIAILNNDWMHLEGNHFEDYIAMRTAYENDLRAIIKTGISHHEIKFQNIDLVLFSLLSTLRTLHLWYRKRSDVDTNTLKIELTEILLKGILLRD